jgi:hypothetical protein
LEIAADAPRGVTLEEVPMSRVVRFGDIVLGRTLEEDLPIGSGATA